MSTPAPILQYTLSDATMKGLLPAGYTPLAYIESSGTQWINSGIALNSSTSIYRFECKVGASTRDGHSHSFFGTSSYQTGMMGIYHYNTNNYYSQYIQGSAKGTTNFVVAKGDIIEYYLQMNMSAKTYASKIAYNNEVTGSFTAMSNTTDTIRVFKSDDFAGGYWKCYYFRIAKDNVLQVDLIPARRDSDGAIGMYDLVSRTFKTNSGSGSFIAGPELAVGKGGGKSLPEEYQQVEYLESTGTQYINAGLTTTGTQKFKLKWIDWKYSENYAALFGSNSQWGNTFLRLSGVSFLTNSSPSYKAPSATGTCYGEIELYSNGTAPVGTINGDISMTSYSNTDGVGNTLTIFRGGANNKYAVAKLMYLQVYDGSTLQRYFFPCYRKSDGKPGMYDTVNGVFYTNAGSGEFILGPTVCPYYSWEPNAGSYGGENILGTKTNSRGKRCDEQTSIAVGSSGSIDCASWSNITEVYRGDTFTVSFDVKADIAMTAQCFFYNNTSGVVQVANGKNHNSGGTTTSTDGSIAISVTTSWQRFTITWTMGTSGTQCLKSLIVGRVSGNSTNNGKTIYVKNVKVQRGESVNATFDSYPGLYTNVSSVYDSSKGWVADFNGNNCLIINAATNSILPNNQFSVSIWVKRTGGTTIFAFGGDNPSMVLEDSRFFIYGPSNELCLGVYAAKDTNWHHYVMTYNKSALKLYIDTQEIGSPSGAFNLKNNSYIDIGGRYGSGQFIGQLTNFTLWNQVLTLDQIKELYGK